MGTEISERKNCLDEEVTIYGKLTRNGNEGRRNRLIW